MNYITACPACETQFLIHDDHLKSHRGKVQCGHCSHVFNAKNRLTEVSDEINSAEEYSASLQAEPQQADLAAADEALNDASSEQLGAAAESYSALSNRDQEKLNQEDSSTDHSNQDESNQDNIDQIHVGEQASGNDSESKISFTEAAIEELPVEKSNAKSLRNPIFIEDLTTDPNFQATATKPNYWLVLLCLLLVIVAITQTIYFRRDTIATYYPQFKPYLVQACVPLNCEISLPKQLDLLTIDDSDMQENDRYQDVINFSSLLINNAHYAQAYPNIELTLTDIEDQAVLRKIIKPADYLQEENNIAAGLSARDEVRIKLNINTQDLSVAGYRVQLTY